MRTAARPASPAQPASLDRRALTVVPCAGVPITACTRGEAAQEVVRLAVQEKNCGVDVHLCNAYTVALADKSAGFREMLLAATHNFPDGKAVVWANQLRHHSLNLSSERVYGPDLFLDVFALGQDVGLRHYLLGSTPEVLVGLERNLLARFPRSQIAGAESPPFRDLSADERHKQVERLRCSEAQVVWVGLGTPKQDWEVAQLAADVAAVFVAVGAAFDFVAGTKKQAPVWMQRRGLEWAFRLAAEPRRLWRRYLLGNLRFIAAARRG